MLRLRSRICHLSVRGTSLVQKSSGKVLFHFLSMSLVKFILILILFNVPIPLHFYLF